MTNPYTFDDTDLDAIRSAAREDRAQQARAASLTAPAAPDAMARALKLERERGVPALAAVGDLDHHEQVARLDAVTTAAQRDPKLGGWLSDPKRAALAQDDLGPLSRLSSLAESIRQAVADRVPSWSTPGVLAQLSDPKLGRHLGRRFQTADVAMVADTTRYVSEVADRYLNPGRAVAAREGVGYRAQTDAFRGAADEAAAVGREARADQQALSQVYARGQVGYHLGQIADSLPQMLGAVATRRPEAAAAAMGLFTQARGVADAMNEGQSFAQANVESAIPTLTETAGSMLTFGRVFGPGSWASRVGTASLTEAGGEAATEFGQGAYEGRDGSLRAGDLLWRTFDAAIAGGGTGAVVAAITPSARERVTTAGRAFKSAEDAATLRAFTESAADSKTVDRAGDEVAALVGDEARVYVPVDEARALYQSDDVAFEAWAAEVTGDPDVLDSGDLAIPAAKWATIVAKLPNAMDWAERARRDVDGYSLADLADAEKMAAEFPELFATDEAAERAAPADADAREQIKQDVLGQLIGSGRYKQGEAEVIAELTARQFTTMAGRAGRDALELWRGYDLRVRAQQSAPDKPRGLDDRTAALFRAARTNDIPDGSRVFGKSLAQFVVEAGGVVDDGGDLASRDAAKQRPGLINNRAGLPLDRARELAAEAGYLPADSTVADFLDLLSQDVDGSPVYVPGKGDAKLQAFRNDALKLQRDIDEAFKDDPMVLAGLTDEQVAEAMSDARVMAKLLGRPMPGLWGKLQEVARSLYQSAFHGSPHKFDRFDLSKMGTGEGAQAFGWGMYFASLREVAESYREVLSEGPPAEFTVDGVVQFTGKPSPGDPRETAIYALANGANPDNLAEGYADMGASDDFVEGVRMAVEALRGKKIERVETPAGQTYQVDIPEDSDLLDWDKPLSEQPEKVRASLEAAGIVNFEQNIGPSPAGEIRSLGWTKNVGSLRGEELYRRLVEREFTVDKGVTTAARKDSERAASMALLAAGIPGLRYLDGVSRSGGEGTHNYVIWDESAIKVERTFYQSDVGDEALAALASALGSPDAARSMVAGGNESVVDRLERDAQALADLLERQPFGAEPSGGLDVPGAVVSHVLGVTDNEQVLGAIVRALPVDVVDFFVGQQLTPERALRDKAVLENMLAVDGESAVSLRVDKAVAASLVRAVAGKAAEVAGLARRALDARSADAAGGDNSVSRAHAGNDPTKSAAFSSWFGDSKVVDENGAPLVVYHGTNADFDTFDASRGGRLDRLDRFGFFFSEDPVIAEAHADPDGARIVPAYLSIANPYIVEGPAGSNLLSVWEYRKASNIAAAKDGGHDGIVVTNGAERMFIAFRPEQIKSATANRGTFDPSDPSILNQQPRRDAAPRGALTIAGDRTMTVDLFERADRSTFLHEMGHFYLEVMRDLASAADAPAEIVADFDTILRWGGIEGDTPEARRAAWAGMGLDQQRHLHEGWAEGFEQFLLEGKAPAPDLVGPFARFAAWMRSIYGAMRQLRIPLSDDIRAVMERMVATDEEIEAVRARQNMGPVIDEATATAAGISPEQYAEVKAKLEAGRDAALARVHKQVMAALTRERKAWWKEELARVTEEVEAEFESAPIVRAWRVLASRKPDGLPPELAGLKLDGEAVKQVIGTPTIPESIRNLGVTGKNGVHPDAAAMVLGFPSGDALLQGLSTVRDLAARVEAEAKARMIERHGDPLLDGSLAEKAMRAAHNSAQVRGLEAELAMLEQMAADPTATPEKPAEGAAPRETRTLTPEQKQRLREQAAARARVGRAFKKLAEDKIAGQRVRDLRPNEHLAAERRAANKAAEAAAKGDFVTATKAKREQILHAQLYRAARNAQVRAEKHVRHAKRLGKKPARQRLGKGGVLEIVEGILGAYSFRPASDKARDRAAKLREHVLKLEAAGVTLDVAPEVIAQMEAAQPLHYRDMTVANLDAVMALVKQLEHQAREANSLRLAGQQIDAEQAGADLSGALSAAFTDRGEPPISEALKRTFAERTKRAARLTAAWLIRLPALANWTDGEGNVTGAFHRLITRPLDAADAAYRDLVKQYGEKIVGLFDDYLKGTDLLAPVHIASLGESLTRSDILAIALNMGNASNLQRLRDGRGWGDVQLAEIASNLDQRDVEFVQAVWDTLESLWPRIADQQERMTGVRPPKIEAQPLTIRLRDGSTATLRGGYYPVVYDRESTEWRAFVQADGDGLFEPMAMMSLPANGFTKQRVDAAKIPLKFDLATIPQHIGMVLKDVTHRETVLSIQKLIRRPEVASTLTRTLGPEAGEAIETKLRVIATDQLLQGGGRAWGALSTGSRTIRRHVGLMAMGYNVVTALKQVLGLAASTEVMIARFGYKAPRLIARGYTRTLEAGAIEHMQSLSGFMRHRMDTADNEIRLNMQRYLAGQMSGSKLGKLKNLHDGAVAHAFVAIQYVQTYAMDIPLWMGAFKGGVDKGLSEVDAAALADDTVRSGQGAGNPMDTALIEQSIPVVEWLTMFYSYASAYLNRQITLGRDVGKAVKGGPRALLLEMPLLSARFAMLAVFPVIAEELINIAVGASKGAGDEDDDGDEDDFADRAWHFGKRIAAFQFYGIPGLRDVVGSKYGFRLSPVQSVVDSWSRMLRNIEKAIDPEQDVEARKAVRDAVMATGYTLGLPLNGPYKHIDYLWRVYEGEENPESVPEFAAAVAVGKREER